MIHHPVILGAKVALLLIILIVLVVLHGVLTPEQFRTAIFVAVGVFVVGVIGLWVLAYRSLRNPNSRLSRFIVLRKEARAADGYVASSDQYRDMIGQCGVALSPLRPSGTAMFGDKRVSVMTEGEFIDKDTEIEIMSAVGSRVIVRKAPPLAEEDAHI